MSRDSKLKWCVISGTLISATTLAMLAGLSYPSKGLIIPLGVTVLLIAFGIYSRRRKLATFVLCINGLLHMVLFSHAYSVLMYSGTTLGSPLIDDQLARLDELLGFHLPTMIAWAQAHPNLQSVLEFAYNTLLFQTAAVVAILGLVGDRRPMESFILRFMISAWLTAILYFLYPAAGPFEVYDYSPNADQQRYLDHFVQLRSGEMHHYPFRPEGLITFPSFHASWAILMVLAFAHRRILFLLSAILNGAVVISTMTTGWHYLSDVIAGVLICVIAVGGTQILGFWLYPAGLGAKTHSKPEFVDSLPSGTEI